MNYILNGHNTFHIREGWLNKAYTFLSEKGEIIEGKTFSKTNTEVIDELGIGGMMVQSLKFWLQVFGLIEKVGKNDFKLTEMSKVIFENDKYLQKKNTLWLLHYNILNKLDGKPLLWEVTFKEKFNDFSREELVEASEVFSKKNEIKVSEKTLKDGVNILVKTYLYEKEKGHNPEENLISPLTKLSYLEKTVERKYKFKNISSNEVSEKIIFLIIKDFLKESTQITLEKAYEVVTNIIKMTKINLERLLTKLENEKMIQIDRAGGLNNIILKIEKNRFEIIKDILESENI